MSLVSRESFEERTVSMPRYQASKAMQSSRAVRRGERDPETSWGLERMNNREVENQSCEFSGCIHFESEEQMESNLMSERMTYSLEWVLRNCRGPGLRK